MRHKYSYFLLIFLGISFVMVQPALAGTAHVHDTVVIKLDDDFAVDLATNTFLEYAGEAKVLKYATFELYFEMIKYSKNIVIIGHGSDDGIMTSEGEISWEAYARFVDSLKANQIVLLNCNSEKVLPFINNARVFTFPDNIDGRAAAMIASIYVDGLNNENNIKVLNRIQKISLDINNGNLEPIYLAIGLSDQELLWNGIDIVFLIFSLILDGVQWLKGNAEIKNKVFLFVQNAMDYVPGFLDVMKTSMDVITNKGASIVDLAASIMNFALKVLTVKAEIDCDYTQSLVDGILSAMGFWDKLFFAGAIIAGVALALYFGGATWAVKLVLYTVDVYNIATSLYDDYYDCDNIGKQATPCTPNTLEKPVVGSRPTGSRFAYTGEESATFTFAATHIRDGTRLEYQIDWNDGTEPYTEVSAIEGNTVTASHVYQTHGFHYVKYRVRVQGADESRWSSWSSNSLSILTSYRGLPNTPGIPTGTIDITRGFLGSWNFYTTHGDGTGIPVIYYIDWGDNTYSVESGISGASITATHKYQNPGTFYIRVKSSTFGNPNWSGWSSSKLVYIYDHPAPSIPTFINGRTSITAGFSYEWQYWSYHIYDEQGGSTPLQYKVVWGDSSTTYHDGSSGQITALSHTYSSSGTYTMRVYVRATESALWSGYRSFTVTVVDPNPPPPPPPPPKGGITPW
ncbi:MAG: PKD domain-containing protein [Candidatus Heimdallarchaeota archaeon]|nr:PKD domain-containing protein [Candidatus Heimdallarchaeota archaeon]